MDYKKYYLDEIMKLESSGNVSLSNSILTLKKNNINVELINDNNNLYLKCNVDDILKSNINNEELIEVRNGGWQYNKEKKCLIKKF